MNDISKEASDMVSVLAREIVNTMQHGNMSFDRTFISVVQRKNNDNTYDVIDDYGTERNCGLALPNVSLSKGQRVYVTVPQGDLTKIYISGICPNINRR